MSALLQTTRVLIVDDDPGIQRMLSMCLATEGYEISLASDGAAALESIERDPPNLLLLDLAMPVLDGMSVLADLRNVLAAKTVRVIVITAHGSARAAMLAVHLGADDFLEKPFTPDEVRTSVARVVSGALASDTPAGYERTLQEVRDALRQGKFATAEAALLRARSADEHDPEFLNLTGVMHEAHGRFDKARRYFRNALHRSYGSNTAAAHNLRRLDEIEERGATRLEAALGDDPIPRNAKEN